MLLKLIFTLSIVVALPLELAHAEAPQQCIGKDNNPKNNFYAKRLSDMVKYVENGSDRVKTLKKRNEVIDARLKELNDKIIPNLKSHISRQEDKTMFREVQASDVNFEAAESKAAKERRYNQSISLEDYTAKKKKIGVTVSIIKRNMELDQARYDEASEKLTRQEIEAKQLYEIEDASTKEKFNKAKTLLLRGTQSQKNQFQKVDEEEAAQLASTDQKRQNILTDLNRQRAKLDSGYARRSSELRQELINYENSLQDNEQTYKDRLDRTQSLYDQATTAAKKTEAARLGRIEGTLGSSLSRNLNEVAALEKERNENLKGKPIPSVSGENSKTKMDPSLSNPERYLNYHGIEQIEANIGKVTGYTAKGDPIFDSSGHFEMIKRWWNEQGRKNREFQAATEGQAIIECKDCKIKYLPPPKYAPEIDKACVTRTIERLSNNSPQFKCDSNDVEGSSTKDLCFTDDLIDYTHWSVNNAIKCLSPKRKGEEIDPNIVTLKINRESNFNFAPCNEGGCGLLQTTTCARDEMMGCSPSPYCCSQADAACKAGANCGSRSSGRNFISQQLAENSKTIGQYKNIPNPCEPYKNLIDYDKEIQEDNSEPKRLFDQDFKKRCQTISLEEGMHRNIINGIGLYLFYRDGGSESATKFLEAQLVTKLGLNSKNSDFKKMRDYLALGMYGRDGNTGAQIAFANKIPQFKAKMKNGNLSFDDFKDILDEAIPYLKEIKRSAGISYNDIGGGSPQCALK